MVEAVVELFVETVMEPAVCIVELAVKARN
jgi:hypothetical protein